MTQATARVMVSNGTGRIIMISSEGGKHGMRGSAVYNSTKSAVIGLTRNLAHELGPEGVSIVAVCPGIMLTERLMNSGGFSPGGPISEMFQQVTIGRCSIPDEVASVVAFLASEAGGYAHGTAISVGGITD